MISDFLELGVTATYASIPGRFTEGEGRLPTLEEARHIHRSLDLKKHWLIPLQAPAARGKLTVLRAGESVTVGERATAVFTVRIVGSFGWLLLDEDTLVYTPQRDRFTPPAAGWRRPTLDVLKERIAKHKLVGRFWFHSWDDGVYNTMKDEARKTHGRLIKATLLAVRVAK